MSNDEVALNCAQISEGREIAAYDGDDIDCMQGEETDEGISYVAEDMVYAPCAGSAADYLDVGQIPAAIGRSRRLRRAARPSCIMKPCSARPTGRLQKPCRGWRGAGATRPFAGLFALP